MATPYSRKLLAKIVAVEGHDSASAAAFFNQKIGFIEKEQQTLEYQNYLNSFLADRRKRIIQREKTTAEDESSKAVAVEKAERIEADTDLQEQIDNLNIEGFDSIYPVSGLLNPVADYLGAVSASHLNFVLGRLNPIENFYPILPLNRLGESDIVTRLGNPFSHRLRSS